MSNEQTTADTKADEFAAVARLAKDPGKKEFYARLADAMRKRTRKKISALPDRIIE